MMDVVLTILIIISVYLGFIGFTALLIRIFFPLFSDKSSERRNLSVRTIRL